MIGDVETVSGSYPSISASFETDFDGTITSNKFTASKDFSNQTFVQSDTGLGSRPLGTTIEFKASSSLVNFGKFLDDVLVYPSNHNFIIGSSKDSIDSLIYKGTQNLGGEELVSEIFTDLSKDAFYSFKNTSGGTNYTIQYDSSD